MENISAEKSETVSEKIVAAPVEAGMVIVEGIESFGHTVKKGVVEGVTVVADTTQTVAGEIGEAGKELGRDAKSLIAPRPEPVMSSAASGADAPAA